MITQEFLDEVLSELNTIKQNAKPEEIDKLDFTTFYHWNSYSCIYGQMTGHCNSIRSKEIYPKKYSKVDKLDKGFGFTPLEVYLYHSNDKKHKEIINFLKSKQISINLNV